MSDTPTLVRSVTFQPCPGRPDHLVFGVIDTTGNRTDWRIYRHDARALGGALTWHSRKGGQIDADELVDDLRRERDALTDLLHHIDGDTKTLTFAGSDADRLRAAIEDYLLWEPGRAGHAAAHRRLVAALSTKDKPTTPEEA